MNEQAQINACNEIISKQAERIRELSMVETACKRLIENLDNGKPLSGTFEQIRAALKREDSTCSICRRLPCNALLTRMECNCECHRHPA